MKKGFKDIIFVSAVTLLLALGLIISAILINQNAFVSGKSITLRINYANRTYEYKHIKSTKNSLYEVLRDYNDKLALNLLISGTSEEAVIFSLKSTDISASKHNYYSIRVNGEDATDDLSAITLNDNDIVTISYVNTIAEKSLGQQLVSGGDNKPTYYFKVSVTLYTIAVVITIPTLLYIVAALINIRRNELIEISPSTIKQQSP